RTTRTSSSCAPAMRGCSKGRRPPASRRARCDGVTPASIATRVPGHRTRCLLALAVGLLAAAEVWIKTGHPGGASDFDQVWYGATVLREGGNPYHAIGPEGRIYWGWPLYYPLPAMLAVTPLATLPVHAARSLFAGVGVAVLVH